ncbi:ATPase domain protein, prokaryote domain protein [Candidatus Magnetomorum sp. HK-1]|nr:ATPase domain protein, prokaryote domain protein [Candidatus Magnetomorum sp. HK-1]
MAIQSNHQLTQLNIVDEKILPVEEMLSYEEFTDRVETLRELDVWIKNIKRMASSSTAIIAPRRMGKTVLLDRLVNTVFFKPEYQVAPFYFRMKREKKTLKDFLLEYATTFFRQYIAYCHQDPLLYRNRHIGLKALSEYNSDHKTVQLTKTYIQNFLNQFENSDFNDYRNQWDAFIYVPEDLASLTGTRVAVIIDEFQDMKFTVFNISQDRFLEMKAKGLLTDQGATDLTATFDRQAQSRKAPMLVSGSAVTLIFRTVMGGALGGRFGFKYIRPLSVSDGAILLKTLLTLYTSETDITSENALYASTQVGGHPYYLFCLSVSEFENKNFDNKKTIDNLIEYEIEQGKIFGFWQTHFQDNRKHINMDDDEALGKKIIYYFTRYNNQPVDIGDIAVKLNISKKAVEKKIEKLYLADLVWRTKGRYYAFNDICLMRYIKFVYEKDLEGIDDIDLSQQHQFNNLKGWFLELLVQVTMMKFNHEIIDGKFFGKTGNIEVPLFQFVDFKYVKASKTRSYQIDVYGKKSGKNEIWICECKYTKAKMSIKQVKKLEKAAEALRQEANESEQSIPEIQMWLVSTGGFTQEVQAYVSDRKDIYFSDLDGINNIFRAYGGNYNIPIFTV